MHSQQPPGVVQNWSTLQCSKQNTEQCGYDHAPVTRGRMRAQFPLPHGQCPPPPRGIRPTSTVVGSRVQKRGDVPPVAVLSRRFVIGVSVRQVHLGVVDRPVAALPTA